MLESLVQNLATLLEEGVIVMLAGMAVVFTFLVILVAAMFVMGAIVEIVCGFVKYPWTKRANNSVGFS